MFFSIFQNFDFPGCQGGEKAQKMTQNDKKSCLFKILIFLGFRGTKGQKVHHALYLRNCRYISSRFLVHMCKIISPVFFFSFFFFKCNIFNIKIIVFYWLTATVFVLNNCFSSSSVNARNKFWGVPHLLHICVIFRIIKLW